MSSASAKIRVLVVDDHPVVRFGITTIIDSQPDMTVVAEAEDGQEAIRMFQTHRPDLTIMDLRLAKMGGVECIQRIRAQSPEAAFVVLTTYQGDEDIHQALQAGANGYLIKGMPRQLLLNAIRQVHKGERFLPPALPTNSAVEPKTVSSARITGNGESAGINRHVVGDARALQERRQRLHPDL